MSTSISASFDNHFCSLAFFETMMPIDCIILVRSKYLQGGMWLIAHEHL